jgi:ABC-2 type transport system permease protein
MKGLIIKDFFVLKKQAKVLLALLVFYLVYAVATKDISMLAMITLLCVMLPITTMAYDEKNKWDKYVLSMPIPRNTLVLSKYLFGIMLDLAGIIIVALISMLMIYFSNETKITEVLVMSVVFGAVGLVFLAIMLPILFKFGVEKGRILMMLVIFAPIILGMVFPKLGIAPPSEHTLKLLAYSAPILIIFVLLLSIKISIAIYNKKEF